MNAETEDTLAHVQTFMYRHVCLLTHILAFDCVQTKAGLDVSLCYCFRGPILSKSMFFVF